MAIASGLPVPTVYILDDEPAINSFAAGLTTSDAVVTVTRGALEKLSRDELQGVIAHEFSHILNGDMRMNVRVSAIIFGILVIGLAGRATLWGMRYGRFGSSRGKGGGGVLVVLAIGLALLVVGYIGYFFGKLIQASLSRQREFLADASSVQFTRNPAGITGALKKIGGYAIGSSLDTHRAAEISHFFFAQAFASNFGGLWATHPPLDVRIRAIDPAFDGKFTEPPEVVDVSREPWSKVPHMPPQAPSPSPQAAVALGAAIAAAAGTLTPEGAAGAQALLAGIPAAIRAAARSPHDAPILVCGLLLDDAEEVRRRQLAAIAGDLGGDALHTLQQLEPALRQLKPAHKLPVLQLALPSLKALEPTALGPFAGALDDLVQAEGQRHDVRVRPAEACPEDARDQPGPVGPGRADLLVPGRHGRDLRGPLGPGPRLERRRRGGRARLRGGGVPAEAGRGQDFAPFRGRVGPRAARRRPRQAGGRQRPDQAAPAGGLRARRERRRRASHAGGRAPEGRGGVP